MVQGPYMCDVHNGKSIVTHSQEDLDYFRGLIRGGLGIDNSGLLCFRSETGICDILRPLKVFCCGKKSTAVEDGVLHLFSKP